MSAARYINHHIQTNYLTKLSNTRMTLNPMDHQDYQVPSRSQFGLSPSHTPAMQSSLPSMSSFIDPHIKWKSNVVQFLGNQSARPFLRSYDRTQAFNNLRLRNWPLLVYHIPHRSESGNLLSSGPPLLRILRIGFHDFLESGPLLLNLFLCLAHSEGQ